MPCHVSVGFGNRRSDRSVSGIADLATVNVNGHRQEDSGIHTKKLIEASSSCVESHCAL